MPRLVKLIKHKNIHYVYKKENSFYGGKIIRVKIMKLPVIEIIPSGVLILMEGIKWEANN